MTEKFESLFAALEEKQRWILAIEGGSAAGKTTLAKHLQEIYGATVFHMDDFFLQMHQRTAERFAEPGGNVDRERFEAEVLANLGGTVQYRKFDCAAMCLGEAITVQPGDFVVVEGAYSMHPNLAKYYDFSVFLDISPELQEERILQRNPDSAQMFFDRWIPMENAYFEKTHAKDRCSMVITI